jgi:DNA-binding NarL/FixJ family response regulator
MFCRRTLPRNVLMKLLIVDDSAAMRRCIRDLFLDADETFECSDGNQALRAFASHQPDWVLMDIEMKELDGLSAARQIMLHWPKARIIFVTSHDRPRFREAAKQLQAAGYVLKDRLEDINQIIGRDSEGQKPPKLSI